HTPRASSSRGTCAILLLAPRILNEPIGCRFSSFNQISAGASAFRRTSGVRIAAPAMRRRAARMSSRGIIGIGAARSRMARHEHECTVKGQRASRRGVFVALRVHPASDRVVLPQERTFPQARAVPLELLRATRANTSPIFGMVDASVMTALRGAHATPVGQATLGEDHHWLSRVGGPTTEKFREAMRDKRVYLADGHHRYETALNYAEERGAPPDAPERFVLAYLCSLEDPGLRIFATHRIVRGGGDALVQAAQRSFTSAPTDRRMISESVPGIVLARGDEFTRL